MFTFEAGHVTCLFDIYFYWSCDLVFFAQISESDGLVSNPLAGTIGARVNIYNNDPGVDPMYTPLVRFFYYFHFICYY